MTELERRLVVLWPAIVSLAASLCVTAGPSAAQQQSYPSRPVEIIVPFAPGGSVDITMRAIGPSLSRRLGQPVLIVNKPGGGATIGMNLVAKAAPDGYTLGAVSFSFAANSYVLKSVPYSPLKDFAPITMVARSAMILVVNPSSPATTVQGFIDWVKAHPGELNFTSVGVGSSGHLMAELFLQRTGLRMVHVPFTGGGRTALAQGLVHFMIAPIPTDIGMVRGGRLRALAVTSLEPDPTVPELPPVSKTVSGFETFEWPGLVAPAKTPRAIIDRIRREVALTLAEPEVKARLASLGSQTVGNLPEEFGAFIAQQMDVWQDVTRHLSEVGEGK